MEPYTITEREFDLIRRLVHEKSGINLTEGKKFLVVGRLGKRLRKLGLQRFKEYYDYVTGATDGGRELLAMIDCISTHTTDFFREPSQFDFLKKELLPHLPESSPDGKLRIWSAACSTGEEPYSIAITLFEGIRSLDSCDVRILASDISAEAIDVASLGIYVKEKIKTISNHAVQRHFLMGVGSNNGMFKIKRHLRDMVVFHRMNLMDECYPVRTVFDVIFFRNAMIYFDKPTQGKVIGRLASHLKTGGYLFLGHSETLQRVDCGLEFVRPNIYKKTG